MDDFPYQRLNRIFIVVTNTCSARCKLCSYCKTTSREEKYLSFSFIQNKIIPFIKKYGIEAVCITGGEPTLHPELPEITKEINETGTIITVVTNGSHLKDVFEEIKYDVHAWLFSLDAGNKELHYRIRGLDNFDEIAAWPGKIKTANPPVQVAFNCLLQKQNVGDIVRLYELICRLPCEGIFFNVPELKPHCFGGIAPSAGAYALLNDEEMEILKRNLERMVTLDVTRGKLMQGEGFFENCINYFEYLRGNDAVFKKDEGMCNVPFTSLVVDESGCVLPCFYLPPEMISWGKGNELIDDDYLKNIKKKMNNQDLKEKYCKYCFQFQA
jgi:MoaA/NifB/PqqE/SkfB family radical SAM enzyme